MIVVTIISIIIFAVFFYYLFYNKTENFEDNIQIVFMDKNATKGYLQSDNDNYVKNLTELDLYARKVKTEKEYIANISELADNLPRNKKEFIIKCCNNADAYLKTCKFYNNYINYNDIANIKWIIAYTKNDKLNQYEEGLPHTRENIIFLSDNLLNYSENDLTTTLTHEKIHIYQRYNKPLFDKLILNEGYKKINYKNKFIRSNPDTNKDIYLDNLTNNVMVCLYRNNKPNCINDVIMNNFSLEHPYEKFAYEIANKYYKNNIYINI